MPNDTFVPIRIYNGVAKVFRENGNIDCFEVIELPDHGDLIDIDRMLDDFVELRDYDFASREYVVIPAERSEE